MHFKQIEKKSRPPFPCPPLLPKGWQLMFNVVEQTSSATRLGLNNEVKLGPALTSAPRNGRGVG